MSRRRALFSSSASFRGGCISLPLWLAGRWSVERGGVLRGWPVPCSWWQQWTVARRRQRSLRMPWRRRCDRGAGRQKERLHAPILRLPRAAQQRFPAGALFAALFPGQQNWFCMTAGAHSLKPRACALTAV